MFLVVTEEDMIASSKKKAISKITEADFLEAVKEKIETIPTVGLLKGPEMIFLKISKAFNSTAGRVYNTRCWLQDRGLMDF